MLSPCSDTHTHTSHFKNKQTNRWSFYFSKWLNLVISQMIVELLLHVLSSESHTTLCCTIFIQQKSSLSLFLRSLIWEMCELIIDLGFSKTVQLFSVALQWKWQNLLIPNLPCRGTVWEQFAFLFFLNFVHFSFATVHQNFRTLAKDNIIKSLISYSYPLGNTLLCWPMYFFMLI